MKPRNRFGIILIIALLSAGVSIGQTPSKNPTFEVAKVKLAPPIDFAKLGQEIQAGRMPKFGPHVGASQAEYTYMSLKDLISVAYDVKSYQISGPEWLGKDRFDIVAKMPDGASKEDAPKMLQALLAERFRLAAHRDSQERPVLALVVGKDGPKLKASPVSSPPIDPNAPLKPGERQIDTPDGPVRVMRNSDGSMTVNRGAKGTFKQRMDMQTQMISLESSSMTMAGFADMLTNIMQMGGAGGRQVVDKTGLKGNYQVAVDISMADAIAAARAQGMNVPTPPPGAGAAGAAAVPEASDPGGGSTVFESVKKLGLKLEPRKSSVEQLVIDHVEKTPTEN